MNLDQYNALIAALPLIEVALAEKKAQAARPDYEVDLNAAKISKDADDANVGDNADDDEEE